MILFSFLIPLPVATCLYNDALWFDRNVRIKVADDQKDRDNSGAFLSKFYCKWGENGVIKNLLIEYTHPTWDVPRQVAHGPVVNEPMNMAVLDLSIDNFVVGAKVVYCNWWSNPNAICYIYLRTNDWRYDSVGRGYGTTEMGCGMKKWASVESSGGSVTRVEHWRSPNPSEVGMKYVVTSLHQPEKGQGVNFPQLAHFGFVYGTINGHFSVTQWGRALSTSQVVDDSKNRALAHSRITAIECQFDAELVSYINIGYRDVGHWRKGLRISRHGRRSTRPGHLTRRLDLGPRDAIHAVKIHRSRGPAGLHLSYIEFLTDDPKKSLACGSMTNFKAAAEKRPGEKWSYHNIKDVGQEVMMYLKSAYSGDRFSAIAIIEGRPNGYRESLANTHLVPHPPPHHDT